MFKVQYKHDYTNGRLSTLGLYPTLDAAKESKRNLIQHDDHVYSAVIKELKKGRWVKLYCLPAGDATA